MTNPYFSITHEAIRPDSYALGDKTNLYMTVAANGERDLARDLMDAVANDYIRGERNARSLIFEVSIVPGDDNEVVIIIDAHNRVIPIISDFLRQAIGTPINRSEHNITNDRSLTLYWYNPTALISEAKNAR